MYALAEVKALCEKLTFELSGIPWQLGMGAAPQKKHLSETSYDEWDHTEHFQNHCNPGGY